MSDTKPWPTAQQVNDEVNYKGPHCCIRMQNALSLYKDTFVHDSETKEYALQFKPSSAHVEIAYCPFCRKKLKDCIVVKEKNS